MSHCNDSSTAPDPPVNFLGTVLGTVTLRFTWEPPDFKNGIPAEYILTCDPIFPTELETITKTYVLTNSNQTASVMDELSVFSPGVVYNCTVVSNNTAGAGEPAVQTVTTHPDGKDSISCNILNVTDDVMFSLIHQFQVGHPSHLRSPQTLHLQLSSPSPGQR